MSWRAKFHSLGLTMGEIVVFICNFYFGHVHARQQLGSWFVHHLLCSLYNSPDDSTSIIPKAKTVIMILNSECKILHNVSMIDVFTH